MIATNPPRSCACTSMDNGYCLYVQFTEPFHISPGHTRLETNFLGCKVNPDSRFSEVNKKIMKKELIRRLNVR